MMDTTETFFHKLDPAACAHCDQRIFTECAQPPAPRQAPV
jgi:hypothetical protein